MKIKTLSEYLKETFGTKVYKLSLSSGCTCPNRDGKISTGGCTFCSQGGSGDFATAFEDIYIQIEKAKQKVDSKFPKSIPPEQRKYIAYFQSFTNTYGDVDRLKQIYLKTINHPQIVAVSIGTRPDCLGPEIFQMLSELNSIKPVWVELGLQTIHSSTAKKINRGYELKVFEEAYEKLKKINLTVIVHVIIGLPGETPQMIKETVLYLSKLNPVLDGIKLQLLHVLEGTELCRQYKTHQFEILTLVEYCNLVVELIKLLPKQTVIHRITGDGPKKLLVAPEWSGDKKKVLNLLNKKIKEVSDGKN